MGYDNERTVVLDLGFRQYETTIEMLTDWEVLGGTPTLGIDTIDSVHPMRYMKFVGATGTVGVKYTFSAFPYDVSEALLPKFETSLWVQIDASLAGSQVRVTGNGSGSARLYDLPTDGSWVEIGHTYDATGIAGDSTTVSVELICVGTGTFRFSRLMVRRLTSYRAADTAGNSIPLPFMTDMDTEHSLSPVWVTDVLESYLGGEIRVQHREAPRLKLKVEFLMDSEEEAALIESLLFGTPGKSLLVPFWPDVLFLTADVAAASSTLAVDNQDLRTRLFASGGVVMLWESPFKYEIVTISAFAPVVTSTPFANSWPAGTPVVPLLIGTLSPTAAMALPIPEMRRLTATFDIEGGNAVVYDSTPPDDGGGGGGGPSGDLGDATISWDEPFDQADLTALKTAYDHGSGTGEYFYYPSYDTPDAAISVVGGRLLLDGTPDEFYEIDISRYPPPADFEGGWLKVEGEMIGGGMTTPLVGVTMFDDPASSLIVFIGAAAGTGAIAMNGPVEGFAAQSFTGGGDLSFPIGPFSFVVCVSRVGTTVTLEVWKNPVRGDAAVGRMTRTGVTVLFNFLGLSFLQPNELGKTLAIDRVRFSSLDRPSDPFGVLGTGVPAIVRGPCGWDEQFLHSDFAAFALQYAGYDGFDSMLGYVRTDELPIGGVNPPTVTSGVLEVNPAATVSEVAFGPQQAAIKTANFWYKAEYAYVGGAGDPANDGFKMYAWNGDEWRNNDVGVPETGLVLSVSPVRADLLWNSVDGLSNSQDFAWNPAFFDGTDLTHATLAAGNHTIVACLSEDTSGTIAQLEVWLDPSGISAVKTFSLSIPKGAHEQVNAWTVHVSGRAAGVGVTLQLQRIRVICGSRASNPFGVL